MNNNIVIIALLFGVVVCVEDAVNVRQCSNGCSSHGTCTNGVCVCDPNYTGDDCSICTLSNIMFSLVFYFTRCFIVNFWCCYH